MRATIRRREEPMWRPEQTADTQPDTPHEEATGWRGTLPMLLGFAALAVVLSVAGYVVAVTGQRIATATGLSTTVVGAALTATATSLPELVTTMVAVRRGALQLAVGGIIGGNAFDVLFLSLSDLAYLDGSIYHAIGRADTLLIVSVALITATMLVGLIMRERRGIGFEGFTIVALYLGSMALQVLVS